jgi:ADP-Ribosyltransferase in polyvalent proteins/ParB-like nuclease domain
MLSKNASNPDAASTAIRNALKGKPPKTTIERARRAAALLNLIVPMPVEPSADDPKENYFLYNSSSKRIELRIGQADFAELPEDVNSSVRAHFRFDPGRKLWQSKEQNANPKSYELNAARQTAKQTGARDTTPQQEETDYSVLNIPLDEIYIDKARFQPRDDFSEAKVSEIVNNFNPALFKPLIVWKDPKDGKTYVLAGHHRYEALKRMRRKTAPVVYAEGDEQKAVELAWTENQSGRSQTAAENAKYLRKLAISGRTKGEIKNECQRLYDRSCQVALDMSFLNPRGKALTDYGLMPRESEGFRDMETMAQWMGKLRERSPELTDSHENEVYDYLRENYKIKGKKFTNSADFLAFTEKMIEKRTTFGEIDARLNITNFTPYNTVEAEYDAEIARANKELAIARDELDKQLKIAVMKVDSGETTKEKADVVLKKYQDAALVAQREVLRLDEARFSGVRQAKDSEMALFGLGDRSATAHLAKQRILTIWNTDLQYGKQDKEKIWRAAVLLGIDSIITLREALTTAVAVYWSSVNTLIRAKRKKLGTKEAERECIQSARAVIEIFERLTKSESLHGVAYTLLPSGVKATIDRLIGNETVSDVLQAKESEMALFRLNDKDDGFYLRWSVDDKNKLISSLILSLHEKYKTLFTVPILFVWKSNYFDDRLLIKSDWISVAEIFTDKEFGTHSQKEIRNRIYALVLSGELCKYQKADVQGTTLQEICGKITKRQQKEDFSAKTLLQQWNNPVITPEQREKVRRGAALLNIHLPIPTFKEYLQRITDAAKKQLHTEPEEQRGWTEYKGMDYLDSAYVIPINANSFSQQDKRYYFRYRGKEYQGKLDYIESAHERVLRKVLKEVYKSDYNLSDDVFDNDLADSNDGSWDGDDASIISDTATASETLLQLWDSANTSSNEREKLRRALKLLRIPTLPAQKAKPFQRFNAAFWQWFGASKIVNKKGQPVRVYHGTRTPIFDVFDAAKSTEGGYYGKGLYFTDNPKIASEYALYPDGKGKAAKVSKADAKQGSPANYPVFIRMENPFDVRGWENNEWTNEEVREFLEKVYAAEPELGKDLYETAKEVVRKPQRIIRGIDLWDWMQSYYSKQIQGAGYAEGAGYLERSKQAKEQVVQVLQAIGYDGLWGNSFWIPSKQDRDKSRPPYNVYVVFKPTHIKSAIGNDGSWDADDASILSEEAVSLRETLANQSIPQMLENLRVKTTSGAPDYYLETGSQYFTPSELEPLRASTAVLPADFAPQTLPEAVLLDSSKSVDELFQQVGLRGKHIFGEQTPTIHIISSTFDDLNRGVFWHEYGHHIWFMLSVEQTSEWKKIHRAIISMQSFQEAVDFDTFLDETYLALPREMWARLFSQWMLLQLDDLRAYETIARIPEGRWETHEIMTVSHLIDNILSTKKFTAIAQHSR